jgi:hypothetical protein
MSKVIRKVTRRPAFSPDQCMYFGIGQLLARIGLPPRKSDSRRCGTVTNQGLVQPHEVDFYGTEEAVRCAVVL